MTSADLSEDDPGLVLRDDEFRLVKSLVMAMGLFPEDRLFAPLLPAEHRPGGV